MAKKASSREFPTQMFLFCAVVAIALVVGWFFGRQGLLGKDLAQDSASSWISALATLAIAILTFVLARETWELRKAQSAQLDGVRLESIRPNVSVSLETSMVGMKFADVKVKNLGKGIARNVSIEFLDRQGLKVTAGNDPVVDQFLTLSIFRNGIASMGIGQTISSFLINFPDLVAKLQGNLSNGWVHLVIGYEDVEGNKFKNELMIDFAQFEGISQLGGGDPIYVISQEFKKLRELFQQVAARDKRLGVNIYSEADRQRDAAETRRWMDEQRKQNGQASTDPTNGPDEPGPV